MQVGLAGASRKANFAGPTMRGAYTGLGATRTAANRPAGAELGNWSTTYTNSYEVCLFTHTVAFYYCPRNGCPCLLCLIGFVLLSKQLRFFAACLECHCFAAAALLVSSGT